MISVPTGVVAQRRASCLIESALYELMARHWPTLETA